MIVCAGNNESIKGTLPVGVGLINSAIELTKICLRQMPDEIVFVGSAGSYGKYNIFDVVNSCKASNIEISYLNHLSYTPLSNIISMSNVPCETIDTVNCSNYITMDKKAAKQYRKFGLELENMEFFSILKVAKNFNIKAKGIFVITNKCNKYANSDFLKNHKKAKEIMEKIVDEYR